MNFDAVTAAKRFLIGRAAAYQRVFARPDRDVEAVLVDLARFCRAHTSTAHPDPHVAARLDGRREVWLRIATHLHLDNETLWIIYGGKPPAQPMATEQVNDDG